MHVFNLCTQQNVDESHMDEVEKALELEDLMEKLDFLRAGFDEVMTNSCCDTLEQNGDRNITNVSSLLQEIKELESQVQNETVVIRDPNRRNLDMEGIIESVRAQYANMAARTRVEAEQWNQRKVRMK